MYTLNWEFSNSIVPWNKNLTTKSWHREFSQKKVSILVWIIPTLRKDMHRQSKPVGMFCFFVCFYATLLNLWCLLVIVLVWKLVLLPKRFYTQKSVVFFSVLIAIDFFRIFETNSRIPSTKNNKSPIESLKVVYTYIYIHLVDFDGAYMDPVGELLH